MQEPVPYCFVKPNAVIPAFLDFMAAFTAQHLPEFQDNAKGPSRKFYRFDSDHDRIGWPILRLKEGLARHFQLGDWETHPQLLDFIGYITEGGLIHTHVDKDVHRRHVRINVLLSRTAGCVPLMDDHPIDIPVGAAWLNLASKCKHGTTEVVGPGYRSAISFGYEIDPARGDALYEVHQAWLAQVAAAQQAGAADRATAA